MSERRIDPRPGIRERRRFPRPPLWLNLLLIVIAMAMFAYAKHHRTAMQEKTALLFKHSAGKPGDLVQMRDDLAQMDLTKQQLAQELDARMDFLQTLQSNQFYVSIDTAHNKFQLRLGKDVVREADVQTGGARTIQSSTGKTWTYTPLKGGFTVTGKDVDYWSPVADWVYAIRGEPVPEKRPAMKNWLGQYVIFLPNGYVIHSPPPPDSPLQGPKPGSYMVPAEDLAAIWPRITTQTRVYIF